MTTEERLENVERELADAKRRNRRLLAAVGLAVGVFALVWLVAAVANRAQAQVDPTPKMRWQDAPIDAPTTQPAGTLLERRAALRAQGVIRASRFELVDANGKARATLSMTKDGPGLVLCDENGKPRAGLDMGKDWPALGLFDEKGKTRVMLHTDKYGPGLVLFDENGKVRAMLGAGSTTTPDGKTITYPESSLLLFGPDGKKIWQVP